MFKAIKSYLFVVNATKEINSVCSENAEEMFANYSDIKSRLEEGIANGIVTFNQVARLIEKCDFFIKSI